MHFRPPEVWLITGIPGVGKSTVARDLAGRLERAAHLEGDALGEQVVSGRVLPGEEPRDESDRQVELVIRNQCLLARSYAEAGFTPVMDYVVSTRHLLDAYRHYLMGAALHLVVLAPGASVALERDGQRTKTAASDWTHLEPRFRKELGELGLWLDTADLSVHETVDQVLARQAEALLR
ncbi:MAG: AAA family ATPase [Dehalococcoidia bacterium]|nr:AAA family ATPase [Dehalococcoidia bacterium]